MRNAVAWPWTKAAAAASASATAPRPADTRTCVSSGAGESANIGTRMYASPRASIPMKP